MTPDEAEAERVVAWQGGRDRGLRCRRRVAVRELPRAGAAREGRGSRRKWRGCRRGARESRGSTTSRQAAVELGVLEEELLSACAELVGWGGEDVRDGGASEVLWRNAEGFGASHEGLGLGVREVERELHAQQRSEWALGRHLPVDAPRESGSDTPPTGRTRPCELWGPSEPGLTREGTGAPRGVSRRARDPPPREGASPGPVAPSV